MLKVKSSKGNWTGRKGQLFLHVFLKYIYAYVNKSILKLNICVRLSVSVLLHYNCKINANIQGVYHRPKLERACNVGCRLLYFILYYTLRALRSLPSSSCARQIILEKNENPTRAQTHIIIFHCGSFGENSIINVK